MTIPISPVNISPPLLGGGDEGGLSLLLKALQHRQALSFQRQKFAQDQQEFELRQKLVGTQIAGADLDNEKKKRELKERELDIAAADKGLQIVTGNLMRLDDAEAWGQIVADTKDPRIAKFVMGFRDDYLKGLQQGATTQVAQAQAPLQVAEAKRGLEVVGHDPARLAQARAAFEGGTAKTWGQARKLAGLAPTPSMPDSTTFTPATKIKATEQERRASTFQAMMETNGPILNALVDQTGGVSLPAAFLRTLQKGGTFEIALSQITSPEQKQLVAAARQFIAAWQYFSSGQQINEGEYLRLLNATVE